MHNYDSPNPCCFCQGTASSCANSPRWSRLGEDGFWTQRLSDGASVSTNPLGLWQVLTARKFCKLEYGETITMVPGCSNLWRKPVGRKMRSSPIWPTQ